jgi:hypothetical protein
MRGGTSSIQASPEPEPQPQRGNPGPYQQQAFSNSFVDVPRVPHNEYPQNGMTQFCRTGPASSVGAPSFAPSDLGSNVGSNVSSNINRNRPESRDSFSDYSDHPSRFNYDHNSSVEPTPTKEPIEESPKKSTRSFFKSPFRKSSKPEKEHQPSPTSKSANRNTWGASTAKKMGFNASANQSRVSVYGGERSISPEPLNPNAKIQLNVGNNVFDVASDHDRRNKPHPAAPRNSNGGMMDDPSDPLVQALDELNRVTSKVSKSRNSADHHFQIPSPAPPRSGGRASPLPGAVQTPIAAAQRGTPPPSYDSPNNVRSTLSAPPSAHTSREMQNITSRYVNQRRGVYESPGANRSQGNIRATSPQPGRRSPQPGMQQNQYRAPSPQPRSHSPQPGMQQGQYRPPSSQGYRGPPPQSQQGTPTRPGGYGGYASRGNSPGMGNGGAPPRARSPQPGYGRPNSSMAGDMSMQLSRGGDDRYGTAHATFDSPMSNRARSKSAAGGGQYTKDGRPILHIGKFFYIFTTHTSTNTETARALYSYAPQIPEELGFTKGEMLAVTRLQDDGWWEAEVTSRPGRGLVPSNYLQPIDR